MKTALTVAKAQVGVYSRVLSLGSPTAIFLVCYSPVSAKDSLSDEPVNVGAKSDDRDFEKTAAGVGKPAKLDGAEHLDYLVTPSPCQPVPDQIPTGKLSGNRSVLDK